MAIRRIDYIDDGAVKILPSLELQAPDDSPPDWAAAPPWFDQRWLVLPMGGFLVRTDDHTIVVDAGLGPNVDPQLGAHGDVPVNVEYSGRLLDSLRALRISPDDVTDVVVTHLHYDHVGWIAPHGTPIFERAQHHCHRADFDWVSSDDDNPTLTGVIDTVKAVSDLLVVHDGERSDIATGVALRQFAGHTPGNCVVDLDTAGGRRLLLGDTAHHPVLLLEDGWLDHFDLEPQEAARARQRLAEEIERTEAIGVGAHFPPDARAGRIRRGADGKRYWQPVPATPFTAGGNSDVP